MNYIKIFSEVEILSNSILNEDQFTMLNFLSLPCIYKSSEESMTKFKHDDIEKVYLSYQRLVQEKNSSKINANMIKKFVNEINDFKNF
jgi:hypothetical protein